MDSLSKNKFASDNNIGNINSNNTDIFGIGKAVQAYFDYKKYSITITEKNLETLHHLIRKEILTAQSQTKDFIDKIFKLYEKDDVKISMATLRVLEYMDDELLEAIKEAIDKGVIDPHYKYYGTIMSYDKMRKTLFSHGLGTHGTNVVAPQMFELIELIKLTQC